MNNLKKKLKDRTKLFKDNIDSKNGYNKKMNPNLVYS